jgi:predicted small lipoprotein YifL
MKRILVLMAVTAIAMSGAACGKRGQLERPPPLWGSGQDVPAPTPAQK